MEFKDKIMYVAWLQGSKMLVGVWLGGKVEQVEG